MLGNGGARCHLGIPRTLDQTSVEWERIKADLDNVGSFWLKIPDSSLLRLNSFGINSVSDLNDKIRVKFAFRGRGSQMKKILGRVLIGALTAQWALATGPSAFAAET